MRPVPIPEYRAREAQPKGKQQIEHALFRSLLGAVRHFVQFFLADHVDGCFHQVAHHRFHVAAYVADFRVLRSFHFDERAACEARQPPRNFRLPHAGRANHQNVLWQYVFRDFRRQLLAAHAVAQRHGHGPLGRILPDDIFVEFRHDFPRRHVIEGGEKFLSFDGFGPVPSRRENHFLFSLARHELLSSFDAQKPFGAFLRPVPRALRP